MQKRTQHNEKNSNGDERLMILKIYGQDAKQIKEGETFTAKIGYVEGRTVVTLESKD